MAQYDTIAAQLDSVEQAIHLYRENVEWPSFLRALGPVDGKRVLDVGCGDGPHARLVAQRGAAGVVGTDSSGEMIRLAEAAEAEDPLGVTYQVHDVATMPCLGAFDLVIAVNVLHYADSAEALDGMCRQIAENLAPGGRLLAYVGNADVDPDAVSPFGYSVDRPAGIRPGDQFTITIRSTPPASLQVYYWPPVSLSRALESAGLSGIVWEEMILAPDNADDPDLARLLKSPPNLLLSAYKK